MPISKPLHRDRAEKSSSFHGNAGGAGKLRRPKTLPNFASPSMIGSGSRGVPSSTNQGSPKLTKLLVNVTIQGSIGAVQALMKPESTVADLIEAAVRQYVKEGRRPVLQTSDSSGFDLHYSQFSLQSLNREETLVQLGSRNFFLCRRNVLQTTIVNQAANTAAFTTATTSSSACNFQADKAARTRFGLPWLNFIGLLQ